MKNRIYKYIKRIMKIKKIDTQETDEYLMFFKKICNCIGYTTSLQLRRPVTANGCPVPWFTYPAIEYFSQWDVRGLNVFEYSSGYSSLFWAEHGANVYCVEHDRQWYDEMLSKSSSLKQLLYYDNKEKYSSSIDAFNIDFDIVVIDGVWRNECANAVVNKISDKTIIILDNSDWYIDVSEYLRNSGYFQIDFNGFGPINTYTWTTSLFLKYSNKFSNRISNPVPICGIKVMKDNELW